MGENQSSRKSGQWRTRTSEAPLGASDLQSGALATLPTVHYINSLFDGSAGDGTRITYFWNTRVYQVAPHHRGLC
jgi:hypothetical protein